MKFLKLWVIKALGELMRRTDPITAEDLHKAQVDSLTTFASGPGHGAILYFDGDEQTSVLDMPSDDDIEEWCQTKAFVGLSSIFKKK